MKFWNGPYLPTFLVYWDAFLLLYVFEHIQDDITGVQGVQTLSEKSKLLIAPTKHWSVSEMLGSF